MPPLFRKFDINNLSTDEDITLFLGTRRTWDLDLVNVICGLDPFSIEPPKSSGKWYLYSSEAPQYPYRGSAITETESGFWRIKDECRIFTCTSFVGRKTTMEFYYGKVPNGNRTRWRMHKYEAEEKTSNGFYNKKDYNNSLFGIFLHNDHMDYEEQHYSRAGCECAIQLHLPILQEPGQKISPSRDVLNRSLGQLVSSGSIRERLDENVMKDTNATWDLVTEDYVELNDFCDSEHAELTVAMSRQGRAVYSESQGELYSDEDYFELNDMCSPVISSKLTVSMDDEDYFELNDMCSPVISSKLTVSMDEEEQSTFSESISESLNENTVKDTHPKNIFSDEEYRDVNDLCSPGTSSFSSDNSSHMSIDSYDYFDSDALLMSIRDEGNLREEERTNHRFTVSRAAESNQFVLRLPSPVSVHSNSSIAVEESAPASSLPENGMSYQETFMSNYKRANKRCDSKTGKTEAKETNQATDVTQVRGLKKVAKIAKFGKKYCCFGPF